MSSFRNDPFYVLVRVGPHRFWSSRPKLIENQGELDYLKEVGKSIEQSGLGTAKVLSFLGKPTMDLLMEADEPKLAAPAIREALRSFSVRVEPLGRSGDLTYVRHMWRHL